MGMTIAIHAETTEEWKALQAEGAPTAPAGGMSMSYTSAHEIMEACGLERYWDDDGFVFFDAREHLAAVEETVCDHCFFADFREVVRAAARLGRRVSGA